MKKSKIFLTGIIKENPTFVMMLGMCPTLAVTKTVESALGMGMCLLFVLFFSNLIISCLKNIIPNEKYADYVINSFLPYELGVIKPYLLKILPFYILDH